MIQTKDLKKTYQNGRVETAVLRGVDLDIKSGEFVGVMGKSGSGKSTLLHQLGLLDSPTSGTVLIGGRDPMGMNEHQKTLFRLRHFGYIFQDYALVPELTALENIVIPLIMRGEEAGKAKQDALDILNMMDLKNKQNNMPSQLSGGEQQRVSVARAIVHKPDIVFADEPTANLDSKASENIIEILGTLHQMGQTIVMVTHELEYAGSCDRIIYLDDGVIAEG